MGSGFAGKSTLRDQGNYKIGSCNIGKLNFSPSDHFFHLDDRLQRIRLEVKEYTDPDILNLRKPRWNSSCSTVSGPRVDYRKDLFNIRAGFADTRITSLNRKTLYPGCDELRNDITGKEMDE